MQQQYQPGQFGAPNPNISGPPQMMQQRMSYMPPQQGQGMQGPGGQMPPRM